MTRLGELLVNQKLVTQEIIDKALRMQVGGNRRLGHLLVQMKALSSDQLAEALSSQLNTPICQINDSFSTEVRSVVPRYLCKKYGVLPLCLKDNNILELAMGNPSDDEAIRDLEDYTGKAIQPLLARQSEIDSEIPRKIPLSFKDLFSPNANIWTTRASVAACMILILVVGSVTFKYIKETKYGTISTTANSIIYKNHDLMVGFNDTGSINLLGRGAFAKGYYSVSFEDSSTLKNFLDNRKSDLSGNQISWLEWVLNQLPKR